MASSSLLSTIARGLSATMGGAHSGALSLRTSIRPISRQSATIYTRLPCRRFYSSVPFVTPNVTGAAAFNLEELTGEAYYRYFLDFEWKPAFTRAGDWLRLLDVDALKAPLPKELQEDPLKVTQDFAADFDLVEKCLVLHVALMHSGEALTKDDIRQRFKETRPGQKALYYFLKSGNFHKVDLTTRYTFADCVVHALIAEDANNLAWNWITIVDRPEVAKASAKGILYGHSWKGKLLYSLVDAYAFWSDRPDYAKALTAFRLAAERDRPHLSRSRDYDGYIPLAPAGRFFLASFFGAENTDVHPEHYDYFIRTLSIWLKEPGELLHSLAGLHLHHPSGPNPEPWRQFLRVCQHGDTSHPYFRELKKSSSPGLRRQFFWSNMRAAQAFERKNMPDIARWVLDVGKP